jgi:hypothetical protein
MRSVLLALLGCLAIGCMPKGSSIIDDAAAKAEANKHVLPAGVLKPEQVGVTYYPGADLNLSQSREYDEGGAHIMEVILSTRDDVTKVRDYYEKELGAKAMPTVKPVYAIMADRDGRHYEVTYMDSGEGDHTIGIKVATKQP